MKAENFCYWLKATFEVMGAKSFNEEQTKTIKAHLDMVFVHDINPKMSNQEHQDKLNSFHYPPPKLDKPKLWYF